MKESKYFILYIFKYEDKDSEIVYENGLNQVCGFYIFVLFLFLRIEQCLKFYNFLFYVYLIFCNKIEYFYYFVICFIIVVICFNCIYSKFKIRYYMYLDYRMQ